MPNRRVSRIVAAVFSITIIAASAYSLPFIWNSGIWASGSAEVVTDFSAPVPKPRSKEPTSDDLAPNAAFAPGNLVIYRVGTGAAALGSEATAVFLDEYTTAGVLVQSIPMPTTGSGSNRRLTASGTATSEGMLTRSSDGRYLVAAGYDAALATGGVTSSTSATVNRVIARVNAAGTIDTSTALTDAASGSNPRGAASTNGTDLWMTGGAGGVRYTTLGGTTSIQLSTTVTNLRAAHIFDEQLYISTASGAAVRIGTVGTGTPTAAAQTITNLPGFPSTGSPYQFFLADRSPTVAGVDTLYYVDDGTGFVSKYSFDGTTWTSRGSTFIGAVRGITGTVIGSSVNLYLTLSGTSSSLLSLADTDPFDSGLTPIFTLLATSATNTAFRGVALAPAAGPEINLKGNNTDILNGDASPSLTDHTDFGNANLGSQTTRTFTIENTGTANLDLDGIEIGGANFEEFNISQDPISPVLPGGSTTFQVTFDPSAVGLRTATISVANNDADENPYNCAIQGTGIDAPEINVRGNGQNIAYGDVTPSTADHTDFGSTSISGGTVDRTYTIENIGSAPLFIVAPLGFPNVTIGGPNASDFMVESFPDSVIPPGGLTTLTIRFDPSASGLRSASVSFSTNDADEDPFSFNIQGTGDCSAGPITVTNISDNNVESLRDAVNAACEGATINFDTVGVFATSRTITLTSGEIVIDKDLTINGTGVANLKISGNDNSRHLRTKSGVNLSISGITFTDGNGAGTEGSGGLGGSIRHQGINLNISACKFDSNFAGQGAAIQAEGGITAINESTLSNNTGIDVLRAVGTALVVSRTTISGNSGIGIFTSDTPLTLTNSTISGNNSSLENTLAGAGLTLSGSTATITSSTITENIHSVAAPGSGIGIMVSGGTLTVRNSIVAKNQGAVPLADIFLSDGGTFISAGYNLVGDPGSVTSFNAVGDQVGTTSSPLDPMLGPLANNGGPTFTHKPLPGYPGHDKGCAFGSASDQRGYQRTVDWPSIANGTCTGSESFGVVGIPTDIGAVELLMPTAANVIISGRVFGSNGRGLANVYVSAFDMGGSLVKFGRTNTFGYFTIFDVPAGADYVINVSSKRYSFSNPTIPMSVMDNVEGIIFVANP